MKLKIPPPIVAVIFAFMMSAADRAYPSFSIVIPGRTIVAVLLVALGFAIAFAAFMTFRKAETTIDPLKPSSASALVRSGVFGVSRNPMYVGLALFLIALGIWLGNIVNLATFALFVTYLTVFQIKPEEEALAKLFGAEYESYCVAVRRWI